MQVDQYPQAVLIRPVDGTDDTRPGIDVGRGEGFESCTLAVDRTEIPAITVSARLFDVSFRFRHDFK